MASVRVGLFPPDDQPLSGGQERFHAMLARIGAEGVDHLCVGDHVSFFVGAGSDGLITATSMLAAQNELPVYVGLFLLPLRHPVPLARQLATIAQLAPGRLTLGVGIGGEDPHEIEICGVEPKTRGRRMDESLQILRSLGDGTPVTFEGEFFSLHDALIVPRPSPRLVRLWLHPGGRACAIGHPDAGLLPDALRAVRALLALRHARAGRRVSQPLHRRRVLGLQRDPVRCGYRHRD
jgi:alkanesulfonate monooxygenase SsuD/methylene tetrahydromethanopterin reductase-like flavin-dependent oxidoreductase (luciferase family)